MPIYQFTTICLPYETLYFIFLRDYTSHIDRTGFRCGSVACHTGAWLRSWQSLRSVDILGPEYTTLHYTSLQYSTVHYTTLHFITVLYSTLHHITLHYSTLQYTTLHYTSSQYFTVHYTATLRSILQCTWLTMHPTVTTYSTIHSSWQYSFLLRLCAIPPAPTLRIPNIGNGLVALGIIKR